MTQIKIRNEKEVITDNTEIQRIIRNYYIFVKYKCSGIAFLLQSSRNVSNEQPCLKATGLYDDLLLLSSLFHFFYFIFRASISFSFLISPSLLYFNVLSQAFTKHSVCIYIYIYTHTHIYTYI